MKKTPLDQIAKMVGDRSPASEISAYASANGISVEDVISIHRSKIQAARKDGNMLETEKRDGNILKRMAWNMVYLVIVLFVGLLLMGVVSKL